MLSRANYSKEHILELHEQTGANVALLEKVMFAFGLLEALVATGMPCIFKGGTSLMLLLKPIRRLSIDIDLLVPPGTDIDEYIARAGQTFPFVRVEERKRPQSNNVPKRHFYFFFAPPLNKWELSIILDVVFEESRYLTTISRPIANDFLLTEGENLVVTMPDVNNILADKLTAFAPHSTGINLGVGKEIEIVKQLFDCGVLFDEAGESLGETTVVYRRIVEDELTYKNLDLTLEQVLQDTIDACASVVSMGRVGTNDYREYLQGIKKIHDHMLGAVKFNSVTAAESAAKVMYLAAKLLAHHDTAEKITFTDGVNHEQLSLETPKTFNKLKNVISPLAYAYLVATSKVLREVGYNPFMQ